MRRFLPLLPLSLLPALLIAGCGAPEDFGERKTRKRGDAKTGDDAKDDTTKVAELKAVEGKGVATLKGVVKLEGDLPDFEALDKAFDGKIDKDRPTCLMASPAARSQFSWVVDKGTKGVSNVFVWIRPEDDKTQFFDVKKLVEEGKGFDKVKEIDQPYCAFDPHAIVLFQRYVDPAKPSRRWGKDAAAGGPPSTGQQFIVKNTGGLFHNASWAGTEKSRLKGDNKGVPSKGQLEISDIQPYYLSDAWVACAIHTWMKSYIWSFEHPFACVTGSVVGGKKLAPGEFRIENIPAGVKLRVVAWHEEGKFLNGGHRGEVVELKSGEDNVKDFTLSYK